MKSGREPAAELPDIDLNSIQDEHLRGLIAQLLNHVQALTSEVKSLREEKQKLSDEIARLKGEQGKPTIPPNKPSQPGKQSNHSSEAERHKPRPRNKRCKQVKVHREVTVDLDRATLPPDAQFKGYEERVVQEVVFQADNVRFRREKFYSPSTGRTYLAPLPAGYEGSFGPGLRSLVLGLYYDSNISEPKILGLLGYFDIQISAGELSNLLIKNQDIFHQERAEVFKAGLASSPWQMMDDTSTRIHGVNHACQVVCNPLFTVYCTRRHKDRMTVIEVLAGWDESKHLVNQEAVELARTLGASGSRLARLGAIQGSAMMSRKELLERMAGEIGDPGVTLTGAQARHILEATAIAAYHTQQEMPVVRTLVTDDAPQYMVVTEAHANCWVHEGRHYKKLTPMFTSFKEELDGFRSQFWDFYDELLAYKQHPSPEEAQRLEACFDELFSTEVEYEELAKRIRASRGRKKVLLLVLKHPELPLNTNDAELGARARVRKRDVSFGPQTADGVAAWDTFQSLAATAKKLSVNFLRYLEDRIRGTGAIPRLAGLIRARAAELNLAASWSLVPSC